MNLVVTIAVGNKTWGERALNLSLSIKANDDEQKTMLIYTKSAIEGIESLIDEHFDYGLLYEMDGDNPSEFAFHLKTRLYSIVSSVCKDFQAVIYLDADTIIIPGKSTKDWFDEHFGTPFTSYCNDVYDYETKTRKRTDYTFWCDPEKVKSKFNISDNAKMPQINTSFMRYKASPNRIVIELIPQPEDEEQILKIDSEFANCQMAKVISAGTGVECKEGETIVFPRNAGRKNKLPILPGMTVQYEVIGGSDYFTTVVEDVNYVDLMK